MKTINQVVNGLSEEELKKIAREKFCHIAHGRVQSILMQLNAYAQTEVNAKLAEFYSECYEAQKREIQKLDLWNPLYDELYQEAIKGKLENKEFDRVITD